MKTYELLKEQKDEYYTNIINKLKEHLQINKPVNVHFDANPSDFDKGQTGATYFDTRTKSIEIYINPQSLIIRAICHEMVHAKQIDDGRLFLGQIKHPKTGEPTIVMQWEGKMVSPEYDRNSPWELEAHIQEKELFDFVTGR